MLVGWSWCNLSNHSSASQGSEHNLICSSYLVNSVVIMINLSTGDGRMGKSTHLRIDLVLHIVNGCCLRLVWPWQMSVFQLRSENLCIYIYIFIDIDQIWETWGHAAGLYAAKVSSCLSERTTWSTKTNPWTTVLFCLNEEMPCCSVFNRVYAMPDILAALTSGQIKYIWDMIW